MLPILGLHFQIHILSYLVGLLPGYTAPWIPKSLLENTLVFLKNVESLGISL